MRKAKLASVFFSAAILTVAVLSGNGFEADADSTEKYIIINGNSAETAENHRFNGLGAVSSGASLRLLADYKSSSPDEYREILTLLFSKESGASISHLFIELGSDINTGPCVEPSAMRSADDVPDISGNAGWQIAADALEINPDISVGIIRIEEPRFLANSNEQGRSEGLETCYHWYISCIEAIYDTYGIKLDYISANSDNDNTLDYEWITYLSQNLKSEQDCRYDYGKIKIGVSLSSEYAAAELLKNENLCSAIDVVDCRKALENSSDLQSLADEYGLELYNLGLSSPTDITDPSAKNTPLDFAESLIDMYCRDGITLSAANPPSASCYSGTKYYPEGFITADTPWSGSYTVNAGFWAAAHFTRFADMGWQFVKSACLPESSLVLTDPDSGDYSVILLNNSSEEQIFRFNTAAVGKHSSKLNVWLSDFFNESYMTKAETISPETANGGSMFVYTLSPYSIATITTADFSPEYSEYCSADDIRLALPYSDNFEYSSEELSQRGNLPLYINILGGSFEVSDGRLVQNVSENNKPVDSRFSSTPSPAATLGDDSWADYSLSADVRLASSADGNYAGIGIRYNTSAESGAFSGYSLLIYGSGKWSVRRGTEVIGSGEIKDFTPSSEYRLAVAAAGREITAKINDSEVFSYEEEGAYVNSGRISLYSSYCGNSFDNLSALQEDDIPYINRIDSSDGVISYSDGFITDYPSYTYYGHSRSSCDTSSEIYSGVYPFAKGGLVYTGFTLSENRKVSRIIYDGQKPLFIFGEFTDDLTVTADDSEISLDRTDRIIIPPMSGKGMHTVLITDSQAAEIDFISTAVPTESESLSFEFTGTGFGLIGENSGSSLIDVYIDGTLYAENIVTPAALSRQCFYSCSDFEYSPHTAEIIIKGGKLSLDAAEIRTKTTLIKESNNPKMEIPTAAYDETTTTEEETTTNSTEEAAASAVSSEQPADPRTKRIIIAFIIAAAVGIIVFLFTPKSKE